MMTSPRTMVLLRPHATSRLVAVTLCACAVIMGPRRLQAQCITKVCHDDIRKGKFVHGPIGSGECEICHTPRVPGVKGPAHRKGQMNVPVTTRQLCLDCHDDIGSELKGAVKHKPVATLDCTFCHNPHKSPLRYLLRKTRRYKQGRAFCFNCHKQRGFRDKVRHKPVARGACRKCHKTHGSQHQRLLIKQQGELCRTCHKVKWHQRKVVHGPVAAGMCGSCHPPHSANHGKLLSHWRHKLCVTCHQKKRVAVQHGAVKGYSSKCLECHDAHGTNKPHLLKGY